MDIRETLLLMHPTTGALSILATVWVFVEALNASEQNRARSIFAALLALGLMLVTWVAAGYWYVVFYPADKAVILASSWPIAHTFFMEAKEHAFFITLILSMLLPIIIWGNNLAANRPARLLTLWTAALVVLSAFAIEGAGSLVSMGVRIGLGTP